VIGPTGTATRCPSCAKMRRMHTARQLDESLFSVAVEGRPATRDDVLPDWGPHDRLGVVVHEPLGAIGASYLLQLAITAFYDARPARRDRTAPVYPDVYVFHVGARFGDHANFDVYPPRKDVVVDDAPRAVLEAVNDRAITRLVVPDRAPEPVQHGWKEPAQALDRIVGAWAYDASGRVPDADLAITAVGPVAEANATMILQPDRSYHERQQMRAALGQITIPDDEVLVVPDAPEGGVTADDRERAITARGALGDGAGRTETYRRLEVREALRMLHRGTAPPFQASPDINAQLDPGPEPNR
jgi:hypothetical protein